MASVVVLRVTSLTDNIDRSDVQVSDKVNFLVINIEQVSDDREELLLKVVRELLIGHLRTLKDRFQEKRVSDR